MQRLSVLSFWFRCCKSWSCIDGASFQCERAHFKPERWAGGGKSNTASSHKKALAFLETTVLVQWSCHCRGLLRDKEKVSFKKRLWKNFTICVQILRPPWRHVLLLFWLMNRDGRCTHIVVPFQTLTPRHSLLLPFRIKVTWLYIIVFGSPCVYMTYCKFGWFKLSSPDFNVPLCDFACLKM